jgi:hypothetical protein
MLAHEHAGCPRVVEMDVRKEQVPHVRKRERMRGQPLGERGHAAGRTAVEERRPVASFEQVDADHAGRPEEMEIERRGRTHAADLRPPLSARQRA